MREAALTSLPDESWLKYRCRKWKRALWCQLGNQASYLLHIKQTVSNDSAVNRLNCVWLVKAISRAVDFRPTHK